MKWLKDPMSFLLKLWAKVTFYFILLVVPFFLLILCVAVPVGLVEELFSNKNFNRSIDQWMNSTKIQFNSAEFFSCYTEIEDENKCLDFFNPNGKIQDDSFDISSAELWQTHNEWDEYVGVIDAKVFDLIYQPALYEEYIKIGNSVTGDFISTGRVSEMCEETLELKCIKIQDEEWIYPWIIPVDQLRISSRWGYREDPLGISTLSFHNAVDIPGMKNSKIYSIGDGIIEKVVHDDGSGTGNRIIIKHNIGGVEIYSKYLHLNGFSNIKEGQHIKRGDLIGYMGATGNVTGVHLHLGMYLIHEGKEQYLNPALFFGY